MQRADAIRQPAGVVVVFRQARDVVLQGVEGRGGQHARLTHPAAQHFSMPQGLGDQLLRPGDGRAHRRAQPFAEANAHGVEMLRPTWGFDAGGDHRVEKPGAVQMGPQSMAAGPAAEAARVS